MHPEFTAEAGDLARDLVRAGTERIEETVAEQLADEARDRGVETTGSIPLHVRDVEPFEVDDDRIHELADHMLADDPGDVT